MAPIEPIQEVQDNFTVATRNKENLPEVDAEEVLHKDGDGLEKDISGIIDNQYVWLHVYKVHKDQI